MAEKDRRAISLCEMCENYMKGLPCDFKDDCTIQKLFKENKRLKQKNKELRLKIRALEDDGYNYVDGHEMGCW